jgi:hypothetical protein
MTTVEMLIGLKIPDTTAITTFLACKELGIEIEKIERNIYYKFEVKGDIEKFKTRIRKTDIIVNLNKNTCKFEDLITKKGSVLIQSIEDDCSGLLKTLISLGLDEITTMEQGVLWTFTTNNNSLIKKVSEELLFNKHYQKVKYI